MGELILGVDPGGTNGLAWFKEDYQLDGFAHVKLDDLPAWLGAHEPKPTIIVMENYTLWKNKAMVQSGSNMPASQGIGMVKTYAQMIGAKVVMQPHTILQTAVKMSQMPMPKDHAKSHWISAYNHAFWYMVKEGYRQVEMDEEDK